ncbi:TPA: host specificity factor TipJ family phage tail protein [Klebsiella oxytoca]
MTVKIFPSRLPGEPLETYEHGAMSLRAWFAIDHEEFVLDRRLVAIEKNGVNVPPSEWPLCTIHPDDDICIYPIPHATGAAVAAWIAAGVAVVSVGYAIYMMSTIDSGGYNSPGNGDQMDLAPAKANNARLGQPVRRLFGRYQIYPDYLVQPISRFVDETRFETHMLLAICEGPCSLLSPDIKIGATGVSALGDDVSYKIYPPGADLSQDFRSENWFNSTEVGNSNAGTAGLDLGSSGPETVSISADAVMVSGNTITLIGSSSDDDDKTEIPDSWIEGTIITVIAPDTFTVKTSGDYCAIYGDLTELAPVVGMPVSLGFSGDTYDLFVASYQAGSPAVPGEGGNAASITASAAPVAYDFTNSPVTFSVTWDEVTCAVSLVTNYSNMSGVLSAITAQLIECGLKAVDDSGRVKITEKNSPWAGGVIKHSALPLSVFGDSPVEVPGEPSSGGRAAVLPHITLAYGSATGKPFAGIPQGVQRLALGYADSEYRITAIDGYTITVERILQTESESMDPVTGQVEPVIIISVDGTWTGFSERTLLDASVTGVNDDYDWIGPFVACPDGETTTEIEINLNFQNGLVKYNDKGYKRDKEVSVIVQYRKVGADTWTEQTLTYKRKTENMIGFTQAYSVEDGQYEVRMRRKDAPAGGSTRDQVYWQALRARLKARPLKYDGITTIALSVRTGPRIAAQSDRRVSVVPTALYDGYPSRSISGALITVLEDLGFNASQIDYATIKDLEDTYWTPRGETFDYATGDAKKALEVLQKITGAGMGYFLLSDGLASAGREGVKNWTGIITPQEMTEELQTAFTSASQDDYDGVDATYIDGRTWTEETIQCRTPDNPTPAKIESITIDGVTDRDRVYRIGMRRLQGHRLQRLTHTTATELDAMCYQFMDRVVMADDIPGSSTTSCLIVGMEYDDEKITIDVTEPLDWSIENPRCIIRFQDGSASKLLTPMQIDEYSLSLPYSAELHPEDWVMNDPFIEPLRLLFCSSTRAGYDTLITKIAPDSDGTTQVEAIQYTPEKYIYDDAVYPGDVA